MKTFIYTLSDPSTNEIRYVGKSNNPKKRLYEHLSISNLKLTNTHKNNWIISLLRDNKKPILNIIDEVPTDEWQFWEKYWIDKISNSGSILTNCDGGGNGTSQHNYNTIEKMKIRHKDFPNYNKCCDLDIIIDPVILYQKYITENLSLNKCASYFNTSKATIFRNLSNLNIKKEKSMWVDQIASNPKKVVLQYDLDGNLIKEWLGLKTINTELSINCSNIANCCRGLVKSAGGFIWKYKLD